MQDTLIDRKSPESYVANEPLPSGSKVIVAISPGKEYSHFFTKDRLIALFNYLKDCEVTILIADTLQKYNKDEQEAEQSGSDFLKEHFEILNRPNHKVFRWSEWITLKKDEFETAKNVLEKKNQPDSDFEHALLSAALASKSNKNTEKSKLLLLEEAAVYLTYTDYQFHLYPRPISDSFAYLYKDKDLSKISKPKYQNIRYKTNSNIKSLNNFGTFKEKNKKMEDNSLPLPLRMVYENLESVLFSSEIPEQKKIILLRNIKNLMSTYSDQKFVEIKNTSQNHISSYV